MMRGLSKSESAFHCNGGFTGAAVDGVVMSLGSIQPNGRSSVLSKPRIPVSEPALVTTSVLKSPEAPLTFKTAGINNSEGFSPPKISTNSKGQLTNGKYILDQAGMKPHTTGDLSTGKSQFLFNVNANKAALDGAAYADKNNLWNSANSRAKVPIANGNVGVIGRTGEQTNYINVYRTSTNFVHASPANPPKKP